MVVPPGERVGVEARIVDENPFGYRYGDTGGTNEVALDFNAMPEHRHDMFFTEVPTRNESGEYATFVSSSGYLPSFSNDGFWGGHGGHKVDTKESEKGAAHENRPPYYAACFIMRTE